MKPAGPLEIEVKLRIPSPAAVRPLLEQAGYPDIQPGRTSSKLVSYVGGRAPGV